MRRAELQVLLCAIEPADGDHVGADDVAGSGADQLECLPGRPTFEEVGAELDADVGETLEPALLTFAFGFALDPVGDVTDKRDHHPLRRRMAGWGAHEENLDGHIATGLHPKNGPHRRARRVAVPQRRDRRD